MNKLEKNKFTINTRDLYNELAIKSEYSHWIKRFISSYDLRENIDYKLIVKKDEQVSGTKKLNDYYTPVAIKDLIISKHSKGADKSLTEFASRVAEMKGDPFAFAKFIISEWERDKKKLIQIETQLENHNTHLTTFTEATKKNKEKLAQKHNIKIENLKFKRETLIDHLIANDFLAREGKSKRLKATQRGLESGYIDNKVDSSIPNKVFKTPSLTEKGINYLMFKLTEEE